jgi:hypothetical protein
VIPEVLVDYFQGFIDSFSIFRRPFRYGTPDESAYWVAYSGFKVREGYRGKMCCTLSPVLYVGNLLGYLRPLWLELSDRVYDLARAVPYTRGGDPITNDQVLPWEFELSVYYAPAHGYATEFLSVEEIHLARIIRGLSIQESLYRKAKALPIFLYGRSYARYNYTMMPEWLLVKQIAVVTVLRRDYKMAAAFAYSWDKYWEGLNKLTGLPDYARAIVDYERRLFEEYIPYESIQVAFQNSYIPPDKARDFFDLVVDEIRRLYALVGAEIRFFGGASYRIPRSTDEGYRLYYCFPHLFADPEEAESTLKWWFGSYEDLVRCLEEFSRRTRYEPLTSADSDLETVKEF